MHHLAPLWGLVGLAAWVLPDSTYHDTATVLGILFWVVLLACFCFQEENYSLSFGWDPTPSTPLGLTARLAPSWGGQAMGGAHALWGNQMAYGMSSHDMYNAGGQVNAEVGYGLPVGARFVGTPRVGVSTSTYGRDYRMGYSLGLLDNRDLQVDVGMDAQRRESPMEGGTSDGFLGRATIGW